MGTVLVTGAAGNLGRKVVGLLSASNRVVAVDRARAQVTAPQVEARRLDLARPGTPEALAAAGEAGCAIVHLAWEPDGKHNLSVTRHVLTAAQALVPRQLVHLSSATVYGAWPENPVPLTEDAEPRPNPELAYAVEKRASEVLVERWAKEHPSVAVAILRPTCTLGAAEQEPLYRALASTRPAPLGGDGRFVQFLHLDDLASAVVHVLALRLSGTFNVAADDGVSEEVASALAAGTATFPLPTAARTLLGAFHGRLARRGAPLGARAYAEHSWVVSAEKLRQTGWRPAYTSEQALVVTDGRSHWDDLPQGRRVALILAAAALGVAATGAGGAAWWRRRR
jgi:nucleoside-diphosphate-sugar epimerase